MNSLLASLSPKKKMFLTGTLLLTGTGFLCRFLGFFYRIFLSRTIGAEGLGIYNMIHPVFGICFAVCAGSIQTALSQYTAANPEKGRKAMYTGLGISLSFALFLTYIICHFKSFISSRFLLEPLCAEYLPIIALSVPFAALHTCINGYYYGMQKARVPAFSQVAEQVIRMGLVYWLAYTWVSQGREITVSLAVYGHLIGEMASAAFTFLSLLIAPPDSPRKEGVPPDSKPACARQADAPPHDESLAGTFGIPEYMPPNRRRDFHSKPAQKDFLPGQDGFRGITLALMGLALPLMGNRLILNLLASAEAVWIPNRLMASGLTGSEALSVYGVLTGMSLPAGVK